MLSITKIFHFEAGHALSNYKGPCRNIHGHSYKVHVTVTGKKNAQGMLIDFKDLKKLVWTHVLEDFDHALVLKKNDINTCAMHNLISKILWMEEEPTAEAMVELIATKIKSILPPNLQLACVKLYETDSCYAGWDVHEE